jgi:hypothetical protein
MNDFTQLLYRGANSDWLFLSSAIALGPPVGRHRWQGPVALPPDSVPPKARVKGGLDLVPRATPHERCHRLLR